MVSGEGRVASGEVRLMSGEASVVSREVRVVSGGVSVTSVEVRVVSGEANSVKDASHQSQSPTQSKIANPQSKIGRARVTSGEVSSEIKWVRLTGKEAKQAGFMTQSKSDI